MAVRSKKLFVGLVAANSAAVLVYTCPVGVRTLVKGLAVWGAANGQTSIIVRNGGAGPNVVIHAAGSTTAPAASNIQPFQVLESGDTIHVSTSATSSAWVAIGGAELVL